MVGPEAVSILTMMSPLIDESPVPRKMKGLPVTARGNESTPSLWMGDEHLHVIAYENRRFSSGLTRNTREP